MIHFIFTITSISDIIHQCIFFFFSQENGKDKINFILQFKGAQDPTLQEFIYGILIENAPRAIVNGEISIIVGPLAVFDDSLAINQATVTYSLPPGVYTSKHAQKAYHKIVMKYYVCGVNLQH